MPGSSDDAAEPPVERRASIRFRVERPATGRALISNTYQSLSAQLADLSLEGIGLVTDRPLEPGTRIDVELQGPGGVPYELLAEVVHARVRPDGRWHCGCTLVWKLAEEELRFLLK